MRPAKSVAVFLPYLKANGIYRVLDYGAGKMRNSFYLAERGFCVVATDCYPPIYFEQSCNKVTWVAKEVITAGILKKMDLVLCNFVINILDTANDRKKLMCEITEQLRPGGYLLLETRENRNGAGKTAKCALTRIELDGLAKNNGFTAVMFLRGRSSLAVLYKSTMEGKNGNM